MTVLDPRSGVELPGDSPDTRCAADGNGMADIIHLWGDPVESPAPYRSYIKYRLLGCGLIICGVALLPWLCLLATGVVATKWSAAWVGLDALESGALIGTGLLTARQDPRGALAAAATAPLLLADAWFDVMTARQGNDLALALSTAVAAELPLAAVCAVAAVQGFRNRR
jgi:hypothetical protein